MRSVGNPGLAGKSQEELRHLYGRIIDFDQGQASLAGDPPQWCAAVRSRTMRGMP